MAEKYSKFEVSKELSLQVLGEISRAKTIAEKKDCDIAKALNKTKQNYSRMIINGLNSLSNIEAIANALGCNVEISFVKKEEK